MGIMSEMDGTEFPLDTRQLRAFQMVAKTGSFTDAAKVLNVSQSAVSHALKALEDDVGCLLLDRLGKRVFLTEAGEMLLERAQNVLQEMAVARSELRQLGSWGHGRLRLGASSRACQYVLYNRHSRTFALIERYFARQSLALRSLIELGSMEAIKELVKLGLGVGILAPWIVSTELEERSLVSLPLGRRKLRRNWGIFHWKSRQLDL